MTKSKDSAEWPLPHLRQSTHAGARPEVRPTPAAAPSMNLNEKSNLPLQGVLKLVLHGSNKDYYVALRSALCVATTDMRQALRVRCDSLPNATLLERMVSFNPFIALFFSDGTAHLCDTESFVSFLAGRSVGLFRAQDRRGIYSVGPSCVSRDPTNRLLHRFGRMICFNLVTPKPTCSSSPEFQLLTWTLLPTGEANPVWRKDDGSSTFILVITPRSH